MTSSGISNYGVVLKRETVAVGEIVTIDFPELLNEAVEVTNHASTWREYVSSNLKGMGEFTLGLNYVQTAVSGLYNDWLAGTVSSYSVEFPNNVDWAFDALVTAYQPETADAQGPEALMLTVTFQPTGQLTIS